jgi:hypothetical protein
MRTKAECNQLLEMAAAFGVRLLGAALVFISGTTDFRDVGPERTPSPIIAAESKLTTKAAPSSGAPKTPSFYAQSSFKLNGAIDPHGIPLAGNLKVDCWRRIILYALWYFCGDGIH